MHWRLPSTLILATLASVIIPRSFGIRVPLQRRDSPAHSTRLTFTNPGDPFSFGTANLQGDNFVIYFVTLTIDGQDFAVQLDTGSSDLWLDTSNTKFTKNVVDTGHVTSITYVDTTTAAGSILVAEVKLGDFVIPKQAFISAKGTNATHNNDQGLLGIGPPSLSFVNDELHQSEFSGIPLLQNIFSLYPNEPNYMTFLLNRTIYGVANGGSFTIGEVNKAHASILDMPRLPVFTDTNRWVVPLDAMAVDGRRFALSNPGGTDGTQSSPTTGGKLKVLLDTGNTFATAPKNFVDDVYANVAGAKLVDKDRGLYELPCDTAVNVSMVLGGIEYPMNPLDAVFGLIADGGEILCANTIRYHDDTSEDVALGDAFLRNVYSLFDFGNLTAPGDGPSVRLLSTTNKEEAWASFNASIATRIKGLQSVAKASGLPNALPSAPILFPSETLSPSHSPAPSSSPISSPLTPTPATGSDLIQGALTDTDSGVNLSQTLERNSWITMGLAVAAVVLLFILVVMQVVAASASKRQLRVYQPVDLMDSERSPPRKGRYETPYDPAPCLEFPNVSQADIEHLAQACDVATFGVNERNVHDESYRKAGKMDNSNYCTNFNIADSGLVQIIRDDLLEGDQVNTEIRTELYKLNVYGPGGFFKAHKDTPRSEKMFGSLVLVFPATHNGGSLVLRDGTEEFIYDSSRIISEKDGNCIGYVGFYSDVEHKVTEVTSGYRITLTYNLYFEKAHPPASGYVGEANRSAGRFKSTLESLLRDETFLPKGGYLGFGLRRAYPLDKENRSLSYLTTCLKGSDAVLMQVCTELQLDAVPHLVFEEEYLTTVCSIMPSIDGSYIETENGIGEHLRDHYHGKYIEVKGWYAEYSKRDWHVHWVTPMTTYTSITSTYEAYGNEPSIGHAYGNACLLVQIGPVGVRPTIGNAERGGRR